MAQKVQVILVDDIDGGQAHETVSFGLDGVVYEIDLSTEHAAKLREDVEKWTTNARKSGRTQRSRRSTQNNAEIREWAIDNGYEVADRGRVPSHIIEAYNKRNG